MRLLTLAAGAAFLAMSSLGWASTGPATMTQVVDLAAEAVRDMAHVVPRPVAADVHEYEAPLIRIAGRTRGG